jgi:hypothetical protein
MVRYVALLFLISNICYACDCIAKPACGGFEDAARYFIGIPTSRRVIANKEFPEDPTAIYTIRVTERLSNNAPPIGDTEVRTGTGGADCSWHFRIGQPYLFEAFPSKDGGLGTSLCSWTGDLREREALVRSLRSLKSGRQPDSLLGTVVEQNLFADELKGEDTFRPLAGS